MKAEDLVVGKHYLDQGGSVVKYVGVIEEEDCYEGQHDFESVEGSLGMICTDEEVEKYLVREFEEQS